MGPCATGTRDRQRQPIEINPEVDTAMTKKADFTALISSYLKEAQQSKSSGKYQDQIEALKKAIQISDKHGSVKKDDYIGLHNNIGIAYAKLGKSQKAAKKFLHSLNLYYQSKGLVFSDLLTIIQTNLAINARKMRNKEQNISKSTLNSQLRFSNSTLRFSNSIEPKSKQQHEKVLDEILKLSIKINGKDHLTTALIYQNIGNNQMENQNYFEALSVFRKALTIKLDICGSSSLQIIRPRMAIGIIYVKIGQATSAIKEFDNVLAIMKKHNKIPEKGLIFKKMIGSIQEVLNNDGSGNQKIKKAVGSLIEKHNLWGEEEWNQVCNYFKKEKEEESNEVQMPMSKIL